jgi:hypothetical protein
LNASIITTKDAIPMSESKTPPEIKYDDGVPLAPNVAPVILLRGSDFEMGYQYSQQLYQIFGSWALEGLKSAVKETEIPALKAFQWQLKKYAPEFIDMFRGMAAGATATGVKLSYEEVLAEYCTDVFLKSLPAYPGTEPKESQRANLPPQNCSGFAAWGSCTKNGRLIGAGSSDHWVVYEFLLVVLPETGNSYIIGTSLPLGPSVHPAMNNKGLGLPHHGGAGTDGNEKPGYGLTFSLQIQHTLRYANNVDEAIALQLAYPRGTGVMRGGGLWVDVSGKAGNIECRNPRVVRRAGDHGEQDFLYATNNCLEKSLEPFPSGGLGEGFGRPFLYDFHGGWNTDDLNSVRRNLYMWNALHNYHGLVDLDFTKMLWRFPSQAPDYPTLEEADIQLCKTRGKGWDTHIGNLGNELVGIILPDNGDQGLYYACVGPAGRQVEPLTAGFHFYQIAPTYTFYELQLAADPVKITNAAKKRAQYELYYGNRELRKLTYKDVPYAPLDAIFNQAATEMQKGDFYLNLAENIHDISAIYRYAQAVRAFSKCQAYARQVYEALIPQPKQPTDLGLREWSGDWGCWESHASA